MEIKQRLDASNAEHIIYAYETMEITVLGGLRLEGLDRMRVTRPKISLQGSVIG